MISAVGIHVESHGNSVPTNAEEIRPLLVGQKLPNLTLRTPENSEINLNDEIAKKPTVLIFYRGGWCPYCNSHLGKIKNIEAEITTMGFQIIAICPDRPTLLKAATERYKLTYQLLSDSGMSASRAMGIAFKVEDSIVEKYKKDWGIDLESDSGQRHHQLPVPSVYLIGKDGTIHFSYVNPNYKVRLAPQVLLAAANAMIESSDGTK